MRRLEDKIRGLCARAVAAKGEEELRPLLKELRDALRQHVERIRGRFSDYPPPLERRVNDEMPFLEEALAPPSPPAGVKPVNMESIQTKNKKAPDGSANGSLGS